MLVRVVMIMTMGQRQKVSLLSDLTDFGASAQELGGASVQKHLELANSRGCAVGLRSAAN